MKNRYIVVNGSLAVGERVELRGEEFHHAARVARLTAGEEIELFDGRGTIVAARVETVERDHLVATVNAAVADRRELPVSITLGMAVIQLEKFELALQKATELGATRFVPLFTDRSEIRQERIVGKYERWQKIVTEAAKQSGRAMVPRVEVAGNIDDLLTGGGTSLIYDADLPETAASLDELLSASALTLLIGPEGGWSDGELRRATAAGCRVRRLGARRLRAETAAIAAMAELSLFIDRRG